MINLDKYQAVYDIYGLTNNQIEMNTGLTKKEFSEYFSNETTISLEAIKNFEKLYGIDYKFLNTASFIREDYEIINNSLVEPILAKELNYLKYIHYFYSSLIDLVVIPDYEVYLSDISKYYRKLKIQGLDSFKIAKNMRNFLQDTFESKKLDVILEKLGVRIVKRSLLRYGIKSYHVWIEDIPYIVVDKHINNKRYHIAKEFMHILVPKTLTEEENHFLADSFHIYFELYRDSNSLVEVITLLSEDNPNFLKDFMLQHELNIDFFNKLFELHPSTIKYFKSKKVYE
ncbi:hypothetical protein [Mammaliicoccus sciuri]|uniref:hypothetical protein n=1 Tax=Mammaliicoccus sciuri TaxID=1296 RepID=UPI00374E66AA